MTCPLSAYTGIDSNESVTVPTGEAAASQGVMVSRFSLECDT